MYNLYKIKKVISRMHVHDMFYKKEHNRPFAQNLVRIQRIILQQIENSQSCCKIKIMGKIYVIFIELCMKGNTLKQECATRSIDFVL
jgi:hypothetical protein